MSVRARRLDNEWRLLGQLAAENPGVVEALRRETLPDSDIFHVLLHRTSALELEPPHKLTEMTSHRVRFRFPEYYPSVPIEAFLERPVFHPNIHPENGFVCLWDRFSSGDTIVEAVRKLQKVIIWELRNDREEHVMQKEAVRVLSHEFPLRAVSLISAVPPWSFSAPFDRRRLSRLTKMP